jgi:hypothetical protein
MNDFPKQTNPFGNASRAAAMMIEKEKQARQTEAQEKVQKSLIEASTKAFEKSQAYTNVVIIAGYAGAFSIWSSTKAQLPNKANIVIALLLGLSMCVFIVHEIASMIFRAVWFRKIQPLINMNLPSDEFLKKFEMLKKEEGKASLNSTPFWILALALTIPTALGAIAILFYNYFATLMAWPMWPQ